MTEVQQRVIPPLPPLEEPVLLPEEQEPSVYNNTEGMSLDEPAGQPAS